MFSHCSINLFFPCAGSREDDRRLVEVGQGGRQGGRGWRFWNSGCKEETKSSKES